MKVLSVSRYGTGSAEITDAMSFPCSGKIKNMLVLLAHQGEEFRFFFAPFADQSEVMPTVDTDINKFKTHPSRGLVFDVMNADLSVINTATDYSNLYKYFKKYVGKVYHREVWFMEQKKVSGDHAIICQFDFIPDFGVPYQQDYQTTVATTSNYTQSMRNRVGLKNAFVTLGVIFKDIADVGGYINIRVVKNKDFQTAHLEADVHGTGWDKDSLIDKKLYDSTLVGRIPMAAQANGGNVLGSFERTIALGNMPRNSQLFFDFDDVISNAPDTLEVHFSLRGLTNDKQKPKLRIFESENYQEVITGV